MISDKEKREKLWKFLRGYEELTEKYGYKFDVIKKELRVVKLPWNHLETPEYHLYMERVVDRAADGDIIVEEEVSE